MRDVAALSSALIPICIVSFFLKLGCTGIIWLYAIYGDNTSYMARLSVYNVVSITSHTMMTPKALLPPNNKWYHSSARFLIRFVAKIYTHKGHGIRHATNSCPVKTSLYKHCFDILILRTMRPISTEKQARYSMWVKHHRSITIFRIRWLVNKNNSNILLPAPHHQRHLLVHSRTHTTQVRSRPCTTAGLYPRLIIWVGSQDEIFENLRSPHVVWHVIRGAPDQLTGLSSSVPCTLNLSGSKIKHQLEEWTHCTFELFPSDQTHFLKESLMNRHFHLQEHASSCHSISLPLLLLLFPSQSSQSGGPSRCRSTDIAEANSLPLPGTGQSVEEGGRTLQPPIVLSALIGIHNIHYLTLDSSTKHIRHRAARNIIFVARKVWAGTSSALNWKSQWKHWILPVFKSVPQPEC